MHNNHNMIRNRKWRLLFRVPPDAVTSYRDVMGVFAPEWIVSPDFREDICAYCLCSGPNTLDHIVPYSIIHRNSLWSNATAACAKCNNLKGDLSLFEFLSQRTWLEQQPKLTKAQRRAKNKRARWLQNIADIV